MCRSDVAAIGRYFLRVCSRIRDLASCGDPLGRSTATGEALLRSTATGEAATTSKTLFVRV